MNVADSSVRFPITVIVRVLLVIVFGYVCSTFLSVELKPDTQQPTLVVATTFPGAAPEEVGDGGGRRAFSSNSLHVGVHPGRLHHPGGCEGTFLESSANHV